MTRPTLAEIRGMLNKHHPGYGVYERNGVVAMIDRLRGLKMRDYYLDGSRGGIDKDRLPGSIERRRRELRAQRRFVEADLLRDLLRECQIEVSDEKAHDTNQREGQAGARITRMA